MKALLLPVSLIGLAIASGINDDCVRYSLPFGDSKHDSDIEVSDMDKLRDIA